MTTEFQASPGSPATDRTLSPLPYDVFLAERAKIVEARQRVQQRSEHLVTGGAVGALVLSITFLDRIAPSPTPSSGVFLAVAWVLLLGSLSSTLAATLVSQRAFDDHLAEFDRAFSEGKPFEMPSVRVRRARRFSTAGAALLFAGVASLAVFAFLNITFST